MIKFIHNGRLAKDKRISINLNEENILQWRILSAWPPVMIDIQFTYMVERGIHNHVIFFYIYNTDYILILERNLIDGNDNILFKIEQNILMITIYLILKEKNVQ